MEAVFCMADLRRITGQPEHRIRYAMRTYGPDPARRIGPARVWLESDLPAILAAIERTQQRNAEAT